MSHVYLQNYYYVFDERLAGAISVGVSCRCLSNEGEVGGLTSFMAGGWWQA